MKLKQGFTLVEIMIVVAIIGLLAAIGIPSFMRARETSRTNACINNLRQIEAAKEQWALATNLDTGAATETDDATGIGAYIKGGYAALVCPAGGTYTPNAIGTDAECDVADHEL